MTFPPSSVSHCTEAVCLPTDVHTHTPVLCVIRNWEYHCNARPYDTPHVCYLLVSSIRIDAFWYTQHSLYNNFLYRFFAVKPITSTCFLLQGLF